MRLYIWVSGVYLGAAAHAAQQGDLSGASWGVVASCAFALMAWQPWSRR